jgi:hypothetical protein
VEEEWFQASLGKVIGRLYLKNKLKAKEAEVAERLPSNHRALSSIPTTTKQNKFQKAQPFIYGICRKY